MTESWLLGERHMINPFHNKISNPISQILLKVKPFHKVLYAPKEESFVIVASATQIQIFDRKQNTVQYYRFAVFIQIGTLIRMQSKLLFHTRFDLGQPFLCGFLFEPIH